MFVKKKMQLRQMLLKNTYLTLYTPDVHFTIYINLVLSHTDRSARQGKMRWVLL